MKVVDLVNINANMLKIECISALEYQARVFHNEIKLRKNSAFLYIIEGEYKYTFLKGKFIAKQGSVVYLPKGASYKYDINSKNSKCMQFEFDSYYENESAIFSNCPMIALENVNNEIENIFSNIIGLKLSDSSSENLRINANIMLLLSNFADKVKGKTFSSSYKKILPAINFIKNNFTKKIYVETLEKECNLSSSQIRRIFQKELKMSPIEYKNSLLTKSACDMLKGDNTVSEISEALGFDNVYAFSQFFKKQSNTSPSKYKLDITNHI